MHRFTAVAALAVVLAACGGGAAPSAAPASSAAAKPASAIASAAASKPAGSEAAKPAASASAKPAASGASAAASGAASGAPQANVYVEGTVATIDASKVTMTEGGKAFTITQSTSFNKLEKFSPADAKPGQFVGITAKMQPDNTLLATLLRVQDSSGGRPANQSPMDNVVNGQPVTGNLMTNATIKSADANAMVVTLPGGDITVKYAPNAQFAHVATGAPSDVKAGSKVFIITRGDAAINIGVYV